MRELLIVSCSRSGTAYTATLLQHNGLDVPHERIGRFGAIGWMYAAGKPYPHGPRCGVALPGEYARVWHQVRHPVDAISSMSTHAARMLEWIARQLQPASPPRSNLETRMLYWLEWNRRCERMAEWTYRVEDLKPGTEIWEEMRRRLGLSNLRPVDAVNVNSRRNWQDYRPCTMDDLQWENPDLADAIREQATRYGYAL